MMKAGFMDSGGRGEKEKKKKGNESIGASLDLAAMEYNFPPLHEQVVSYVVDEFVEQSVVTIGKTRDEGFAGTGLTGSTLIYNVIATFTCKCTEGTAGKSNFTATPNVTMNTDIGSSVNLIDPHTSTAVSPTSPSKNGSANNNGGEQVGKEPVNEFPSSYATKFSRTSSNKANLQKLEINVPNDVD
ncbi:hypothetical protein Tco_1381364 [Tanacetum coccineum]